MSKGSTSITLTPHHDVPMIFAAKVNEDSEDSPAPSTSASSCQGRPCAQECGGDSQPKKMEVHKSPSTSQESSTTASSPSQSEAGESQKKKTCKRNKQRFVTSKYTKAPSARHNLFTHFPSDPDGEISKMTNIKRAPCKAGTIPEPDGLPPAKQFGDRLTADHKTLMDEQTSRGGARSALIIQDEHTRWIQAYATKS